LQYLGVNFRMPGSRIGSNDHRRRVSLAFPQSADVKLKIVISAQKAKKRFSVRRLRDSGSPEKFIEEKRAYLLYFRFAISSFRSTLRIETEINKIALAPPVSLSRQKQQGGSGLPQCVNKEDNGRVELFPFYRQAYRISLFSAVLQHLRHAHAAPAQGDT
jgi:hypothetical protein